ncbi:TPA: hypothetical protein HA278_02130 [Candidatus Woesearchaeota archaeon]|nr:hypothetical protein [Candidatus Woesearchaeota archaeon]
MESNKNNDNDYVLDNLLDSVKFLYTALHYVRAIDEDMWVRANQFASDFQPDINIEFEGTDEIDQDVDLSN